MWVRARKDVFRAVAGLLRRHHPAIPYSISLSLSLSSLLPLSLLSLSLSLSLSLLARACARDLSLSICAYAQMVMSKLNLDSPDLVNKLRAGYVLSWCVSRPAACVESEQAILRVCRKCAWRPYAPILSHLILLWLKARRWCPVCTALRRTTGCMQSYSQRRTPAATL
jgi:hypothetical protein